MRRFEQVSPPFEGGVAGTLDYLIFINFISRPGWLIYSFLITFFLRKIKTSSTEKVLNLSDHFSGARPILLR
jgi:hypothetical protein